MVQKSSSLIGILLLTLAGLVSGGCGKGNEVKPAKDAGQVQADKGQGEKGQGPRESGAQKADFSVTSEAFAKEFLTNPEEAKKKYEGKVVELTGEVGTVSDRFGSDVLVTLNGAKKDPKDVVGLFPQCVLLPAYHAKGLRLSPKQKVQITGKNANFLSFFINLQDCSLKELSPSEVVEIGAPELVKEVTKDPQAARKKYSEKWVIVCGEVADLKKDDRGFNYAKLKGEGKVAVSVTLAGDALTRLKKGQSVCLRGHASGGLGIDSNEIALQQGLIVEAKK